MRDLDTLLGALTDRLLQAEARIEELERLETPGSLAFSWAGAVGMLQMMPGLVGLWPGAGIRGSDRDGVADVSGNGLHLARNSGVIITRLSNWPLATHLFFNGINGYLSHVDVAAFNVTGTETMINSTIRGLTVGGWFRRDVAGANHGLIAKWSGANDRSYLLRISSGDNVDFYCNQTGAVADDVRLHSSLSISQNRWYFVGAKFAPSATMTIWRDGDNETLSSNVPASLFAGSAPFQIGAHSGAANFFPGRAALCFLCAAAVPDVMIETFYQYSKGLFEL